MLQLVQLYHSYSTRTSSAMFLASEGVFACRVVHHRRPSQQGAHTPQARAPLISSCIPSHIEPSAATCPSSPGVVLAGSDPNAATNWAMVTRCNPHGRQVVYRYRGACQQLQQLAFNRCFNQTASLHRLKQPLFLFPVVGGSGAHLACTACTPQPATGLAGAPHPFCIDPGAAPAPAKTGGCPCGPAGRYPRWWFPQHALARKRLHVHAIRNPVFIHLRADKGFDGIYVRLAQRAQLCNFVQPTARTCSCRLFATAHVKRRVAKKRTAASQRLGQC